MEEDEDDGEELFDSDSDDEWTRFAEQLSLGAADSDNAQTDSDDEQMRFAKQLSLMKMYADNYFHAGKTQNCKVQQNKSFYAFTTIHHIFYCL